MGSTKASDPPGRAARYDRWMEPQAMAALRRIFRRMNHGMVLMWRLGLGRSMNLWPTGLGRFMVIEHTGRRSGIGYRTPVNYTRISDELFCVAAFGAKTDWYRNALAQGTVAVWLPDGRWEATIEDRSDDPHRVGLMRRVLIDSGFAAPLFGLNPRRMDDSDLTEATATYRLVRLRLQRERPSADGPSDLVWVWVPIGVTVLCTLALRRRAHRPARR